MIRRQQRRSRTAQAWQTLVSFDSYCGRGGLWVWLRQAFQGDLSVGGEARLQLGRLFAASLLATTTSTGGCVGSITSLWSGIRVAGPSLAAAAGVVVGLAHRCC
ncbi:hypothetical protein Dimus_033607 [Dionaea muscipula]